jgi:hypothetical protein
MAENEKKEKKAKTHKVSKPLASVRQTKTGHIFCSHETAKQNSRMCFQSSATHLRVAVFLAGGSFRTDPEAHRHKPRGSP